MSSPSASPQTSHRLAGKVICVAGASSGIGAAIATALHAEGAKICIGARRLEKLQAVKASCEATHPDSPGCVEIKALDVTDRASMQAFVAHAQQSLCSDADEFIDYMICCAGVMYFTKMENAVMDQWDQTIDVNCRGVTNAFGSCIPGMVKSGKGKIVTISSDAGMRDFKTLAVYCASKRFVETLTEITRRELVGTGVTLTTICPGDVKGTELIMKNTDTDAAKEVGVEIGRPVGDGFDRNQLLNVEDVANAVVYALTAPSHVAINTVLIEPRDQE